MSTPHAQPQSVNPTSAAGDGMQPNPFTNPLNPGPVIGGGAVPVNGGGANPLCAELQTIMKSVCSLTLLLHKAIDACYPQTSWPTIPYPDGCGSGQKGGCGCKDQPLNPSNPLDATK